MARRGWISPYSWGTSPYATVETPTAVEYETPRPVQQISPDPCCADVPVPVGGITGSESQEENPATERIFTSIVLPLGAL